MIGFDKNDAAVSIFVLMVSMMAIGLCGCSTGPDNETPVVVTQEEVEQRAKNDPRSGRMGKMGADRSRAAGGGKARGKVRGQK